jgi:hypothetical protein
LKAALEGKPVPNRKDELDLLAAHCTEAEDAVTKVEQPVGRSAAALLLESRLGEQFDSFVIVDLLISEKLNPPDNDTERYTSVFTTSQGEIL